MKRTLILLTVWTLGLQAARATNTWFCDANSPATLAGDTGQAGDAGARLALRDTEIKPTDPTQVLGGQDELGVIKRQTAPDLQAHALFSFTNLFGAGAGQVGVGTTINEAKLWLHVVQNICTQTITVAGLAAADAEWDESGACYDYITGTTAWSGGTFSQSVAKTFGTFENPAGTGWFAVDITDALREYQTNGIGGIALLSDSQTSGEICNFYFASDEYAETNRAPGVWVSHGDAYSISTNIGPAAGGNTVIVTNGSFGTITNVLVGGTGVTPSASGANWFSITMPEALTEGPVDIVVQTSDNGAITLVGAYTYNPKGAIGGPGAWRWESVGQSVVPGQVSAVGANNTIYGMHFFSNVLYAGGAFTNIGGSNCARVARYDGTNWNSMGVGVQRVANVNCVRGSPYGILTGGYFTNIGGSNMLAVGRWDGTNWKSMGRTPMLGFAERIGLGFSPSINGYVNWVEPYTGNTAIAVGYFTNSDFATPGLNYIARYDGANWTNMGQGFRNVPLCATHGAGSTAYVGGSFTNHYPTNASIHMNFIAEWTGATWTNLARGLGNRVTCMAVHPGNGELYVGGWFTNYTDDAGNKHEARHVAKWDPTTRSFTNVGAGFDTWVYTLAFDSQSNLIAGGSFTNTFLDSHWNPGAELRALKRIARWDGTYWTNMGDGLSDTVLALTADRDGGAVYAGGFFRIAYHDDGTSTDTWYVAKWDRGGSSVGVEPSSGSVTGGYPVTIIGTDLGDGADITNVTLCGVPVSSITARSATQVVVVAGQAAAAGLGDVRVFSTSFGETVKSNAFEYLPGDQTVDFPPIGAQPVGAVVGLAATASSGLEVSFAVGSGPGSIAGQTNLSFSGVGTVFIIASQAGDASWHAAPDVTNTLHVYDLTSYSGPSTGGNTVTITNGHLGTITNVLVDGVPATIQNSGANWATITMPALGSPGAKDIVIQTSDNGDTTFANAYTVASPAKDLPMGSILYDESWTWGGQVFAWRIVHSNYGGAANTVTLQATNSAGGRAFHDGAWNNRWQDATLRTWLNDTNFLGVFSPAFSGIVVRTAVPWVLSNPANEPSSGVTTDRVFIASRTELGGTELAGDGSVFDWFADPGTAAARRADLSPSPMSYWTRTGEHAQFGGIWYDLSAYQVNLPAGTITSGSWTGDGLQVVPVVNISGAAEFALQPDGRYELVGPLDQTIEFPNPGDQLTTNRVQLAATATSGQDVSYEVLSGPANVVFGTALIFTNAGAVVVVASQPGNAYWNAAPGVTNTFNVTKATASVYLENLNQTYDGTARSVTATTMPAGLTVEFTYDGSTSPPQAAGSYAVTGTVNDAIWRGEAAGVLTVNPADQTINFPAIDDKTTADVVGLAASASSGLAVSFAVASGPATIAGGTNLSFTGVGTVRIVASQSGNANWNAAPDVTNTFSVTKAAAEVYLLNLTQTYDGTAKSASATTMPAGLTVEFTYDGSTSSPQAAGSYAVTGTVNDANWQGEATGTLTIAKAGQTINFPPIAAQKVTAAVGLAATGGGSGNPVTFSVLSGPGSIAGDTNLTFSGMGDVAVLASQAGNAVYEAAPDVTNIVKVFSVAPDNGPFAGGNSVTISNGDFGTITNVLVGGFAATITDSGASWVTITMPATGAAGAKDIVVQTSGNGDITLGEAYTYNPAGWIIDSDVRPDWSRWTEVVGLPQGLRYMDAATLDGRIYLGGGMYTVIVTNVLAFDGTNWAQTAGLPAIRRDVAVSELNGKLYSIGGQTAVGAYANVYAYDGTSWSPVASLPAARTRLRAGTLNGTIYAVGGSSSTTAGTGMQTNVYAFDGTSWSEVAGLPLALEAMSVEVLNGRLYSIGGGPNGVTNVFRFDGTNWTAEAGLPAPRTYMGSAVMDGKIYVVGGMDTVARTNVYTYDGTNWTEVAALPGARRWLAAGVLNDHVYAMGGASGTTALTNVFEYPSTETVYGVMPSNGVWTGGYPVVITGTNLGNGTDITNVTLCGVAATITSQTASRIWVQAGAAAAAGVGDARVFSTSHGETVKSNAFEYLRTEQSPLAFAPASPQVFATTNLLSVSGGSGTGALSYAVLGGPGTIVGGTYLAVTSGVGTITVTATKAQDDLYLAATVTGIVEAAKAAQTINFPAVGDQETTNKVGLAATASSGLGVSFTVGSGSASISDGTNLTFSGAGSATVAASQPGDANWNAATDVTHTFTVAKATAAVYLQSLTQTYDETARTVTATTMPAGLTVVITYDGSATAPTAAGTYAVTGVVNDVIYQGSQTGTLTVNKGSQSGLAFTPETPQVYNTTNTLSASGGQSSGEWSYTVQSGPGEIVGSNRLHVTSGTGSVTLRATKAGDANWDAAYTDAVVTCSKANQAITFAQIPGQVTTNLVGLAATADSGLAVAFAVTTGPAQITEGTNLSFTTSGTVSILASQTGDANFNAAPAVTNTFDVIKATQAALLFAPTSPQVYATTNTLSATGGSGTGNVSYAVQSGPGQVVGTDRLTVTAGTGSVTVVATKAADALYSAISVTASVACAKADQTITFSPIPDQITTNIVHLSATASSALTVGFAVSSGPGAIFSGTNLLFSAAGSVSIRATQAGDSNYNPAPDVTNTFNVSKAEQAALVFAPASPQTYNTTNMLSTTGGSGSGEVTYSVVSGPGAIVGGNGLWVTAGTGSVTVVAAKASDAMYNGTAATSTVNGAKADQTIEFPAIADQLTTNAVQLAASASSGLDVTFSVLSGAATITGGTNVAFTGAGSVRIVAAQSGNSNWNPAPNVTNTFNVVKAAAQVNLQDLDHTYDGTAKNATAVTLPAGLAVELTYDGAATAPTVAGSYAVTGTVSDLIYQGSATGTLTIVKGDQTIAFAQLPRQHATNIVHLSATASSGLLVSFNVVSGPALLTDGTNLSFTGVGAVTVRAAQAGDENWNAAPDVLNTFRVSRGMLWTDYDGDGASDMAVFDEAAGDWYIRNRAGKVLAWKRNWGYAGAWPMPGDYDGNGIADLAVLGESTGDWHIRTLAGKVLAWELNWGYEDAWPVPGDYDGDGICDLAVYDDATGNWHIRTLVGKVLAWELNWGFAGAWPVPGDYDGDGACDLAVYDDATGNWHIRTLAGKILAWELNWGFAGAIAVPGDYDGDGLSDLAVYDEAAGRWYIRTIAGKVLMHGRNWGFAGAIAVPGDYDGDGVADLAVYDTATGDWYVRTVRGVVLLWGWNWGSSQLLPLGVPPID